MSAPSERSPHEHEPSVKDPDGSDREQNALGALSVTNVLLGLLCILFAGAFVYLQWVASPDIDPDAAAAYTETAQDRLAKHADAIQEEVTALAAETLPPLTEAVYASARRDFPKYLTALERQGDVYLTNVEQILTDKLRGQYHEYLAEHRKVLQEEFPNHADEENIDQVMQEFEKTFDRLAERYYLDEFRGNAEQTQKLWAKFEPLPLPGPNEPSLEEQLADYTADWTVIALAEEGHADVESTADAPR